MGVAAEGAVRRLRHLGVMVLMEGFHIERLLEMVRVLQSFLWASAE